MSTRIVIFAKAPIPGRVKTRLIPALGEEGAAQLAETMLAQTLAAARAANIGTVELCAEPDPQDPSWGGRTADADVVTSQGDGDLGERLARAAQRVIDSGEALLLIGTDCPELDSSRLRQAAETLASEDAMMHPTMDGGYALLGLKAFDPSLFDGIAWSSATVAATTIDRIRALGWSLHVGETLRDIDEPADLL